MHEARARLRSPVLAPGYRRGTPSPNKGIRLDPEIYTREEIRTLLDSFHGPTAKRDRSIVWLMYAAQVKIGELVQLEVSDYKPDSRRLTLPSTGLHPQRALPLENQAIEMLDAWLADRKRRGIRRLGPLFCIVVETPGKRLSTGNIRSLFNARRHALGWDKRIHAEGLRVSGRAHGEIPSLEREVIGYLDETRFRIRYPKASESLKVAKDLYEKDPVFHATRIGHDCREALAAFARELAIRCAVEPVKGAGTVEQLRYILHQAGPPSRGVRGFAGSLIDYWRVVSDLAQRQEHGAAKEGEALNPEDARRLIFHARIVMSELDRAISA